MMYASFFSTPLLPVQLAELPHWPLRDCGWQACHPLPHVEVTIAAQPTGIRLHFLVTEPERRAIYTEINQPVYEDSCVECFIGFEEGEPYYNFEFNALGTVLAQFGRSRDNRRFLHADLLRFIEVETRIHSKNQAGLFQWELFAHIPLSVFCYQQVRFGSGMSCYVNFFKCGDALKQPHFLSWQPIDLPQPDFHQPSYFGKLIFQ